MIRIFKHYIPKSLFYLGILECLILLAAIWAGLSFRFYQADLDMPAISTYAVEVMAYVFVVYIVLLATGLYQLDACRELKVTGIRLITSLGLSFLILSVVLYMLPEIDLWRSVIVYALVLTYPGLLFSRYIFTHIVDLKGLKRRVLVLGAGERAAMVRTCGQNNGGTVEFIDFLRINKSEDVISDAVPFKDAQPLKDYVTEHAVQEIVVAIEERRKALPIRELLDCKMEGCSICDATTFIERQSGTVSLHNLSPSWMIFSDGFGGVREIDLVLKRMFDVSASLLLLIASMPILILAAIAVKATSKGSVLYRQERVGLNGKPFNVLKFRSMTVDAEADGVPKWAAKNDVRVTAVGRIIRATRIDEIPQIFNVLGGAMSFVGPRPERPFFVEQLEEKIPFYGERHWVKPGITGWAQLNYPYGASEEDTKRKLEYDLYYIKNYSLFLDFLILIQTVRVVLWPDGVR
ncbi:TIGR03013 family XrtA/PEP-CTERM system glycosyltransferase [Paremcibacter congregatus]|uniref:Sugar transferase n=1 Tax=Paremcibacter congregatus TaxID=2043170 RepID=A0A2G4YNP4_9PROT|nr:TIGR03013 family XrtA/PEP-CTERM system glycosyltransferase [Paremcibacter congregatus]PHZ83915.1 sugar transferase [Paremcibacter congregatus]QDE27462.1 TIGR03013 family PEP-CTERM/XrtA system glycosyltransferase [Paremcibacter congregatus]